MMNDVVLVRWGLGGFCSGLVAGGVMVAFLHLFSGGEMFLPTAIAVGGGAGAWFAFKDLG